MLVTVEEGCIAGGAGSAAAADRGAQRRPSGQERLVRDAQRINVFAGASFRVSISLIRRVFAALRADDFPANTARLHDGHNGPA